MYKSPYGNQNFFPLVNEVYFRVIIKKKPSCNENSPNPFWYPFDTDFDGKRIP